MKGNLEQEDIGRLGQWPRQEINKEATRDREEQKSRGWSQVGSCWPLCRSEVRAETGLELAFTSDRERGVWGGLTKVEWDSGAGNCKAREGLSHICRTARSTPERARAARGPRVYKR